MNRNTETYKHHVIGAAKQRGFEVIPSSRGSHGILVMDWRSGRGKVVVDAATWQKAADQLARFINLTE
jgi:hypothetical protein